MLARTRAGLAAARRGLGAPVVLVPTMGALHQGHRALLRRGQELSRPNGSVVVSVFVNPLQFGVGEDFARYPRTLEEDVAVCAEEDVQQLALVRRMTEDFVLGIEIAGVPIVRDPDGLAISSRNRFLSAAERRTALALPAALRAGRAAALAGPAGVLKAAHQVLDAAPGLRPDYLALVDPATFEQVDDGATGSALLLAAARVGATRLIDNTPLDLGGPN